MKSWGEQNYPVSIAVMVKYPDMPAFLDEIKGLNKGHAVYLAHKNWEGAIITVA